MICEIRELNADELDLIAGGSFIDIVVAWAIGKGLEAIAGSHDHTVTNVLNGMLVATGRAPI
jgi:hypothetical protein